MGLPRLQLFEFNDHPAAPQIMKDAIIESLSTTLRKGRMLDGLLPHFRDFLSRCDTHRVLDLCAGAGGPGTILLESLQRAGCDDVELLLTDLQPQLETWRELRSEHGESLDFVADPVDATAIPKALSDGRVRVIINALHHFPPGLVQGIFDDAIRSEAPIFIAEGFRRDPRGFLSFLIPGVPVLLSHPVRAKRGGLRAAAMMPALVLASIWDGFVSTMRIYEESDLRAFVKDCPPGWQWTFCEYPAPWRGTGVLFCGVPPTSVEAPEGL